jgi:mannose-6-phosphate isomerase-like protein (cupin superfamily)
MIVIDVAGRAKFDPGRMTKSTLGFGDHLFAGLNAFEPGQGQSAHVHANQDKIYFILRGQGRVQVGEEPGLVGPGDLVLARAGVAHSIRNEGPDRLVVMVVMAPARVPRD